MFIMLIHRFQTFLKGLLQAFGILKINDGLKHYSFNKPWYRSSNYYRYMWERTPGKGWRQIVPKEFDDPPEREKESVHHIIKQP